MITFPHSIFRDIASQDFGLASARDFTPRCPGYQNAELSYLIHSLNYFRVSVIGISRLVMIRVLPLCLPGYRNAEMITDNHVSYKWTVQIPPRTLGIYGPDSFATYEDKRGGVEALTPSFLPPI
jgi:hypothetical protein